ncbi:hypothetical protein SAE02_76340 [Skermanella aerolata]|uniref:Phasin domain-containing protein n=1 Tax=Skermanella aerolata TaxID=393310 RepID=A0A512E426_9PROT|nr:phasin family protein [Skermanella aerolata]KJB91420.1 hypothetical protein N826_30715 [Skermanella aerolata KACC 11604]GEO43486.1 hypothetical protein SAE02_76340 [Skermanella aerolata]
MATTTTRSETRKAVQDASDVLEKTGEAGAAAGRKSVRDAAEAGGVAVRHSSASAANGGDISRRTADAAEHNLQAAAGALRGTMERPVEAAGEVAGAVREMTGRAVEQLGQVAATQDRAVREVAGRTQGNLDVMMRTGIALAGGFQAVMREWADTTRNVMQCNASGLNGILHARTPQDLIAAQTELLSAEVKVLLNGSVRIAEASARAARKAAESLDNQTRQRYS